MVFSGLPFLFIFLPLTLAAYFLVPLKFKKVVLIIASIIFYAWGEPVYVLLMLLSIAVNFGMALFAYQKKLPLVIAIVYDLAMLVVFKYAGLFISTISGLTGMYIPELQLSLPIGISFYTFQAMSYVIDVYRGDVKAAKNPIDFGAYLAMFPQLIAGPIVRYKTIEEELKNPAISFENFSTGISRFVVGLGKKVLIANSIGRVWTQISQVGRDDLSMATAWIGIAAFTLQIYFDFSGYSDMAIGMGRMLGFSFLENFDHPYESKSITEFWRRWHMSLGTWFREYVYYPLGGSKRGRGRQLFNIFIVWMLTGFWHGASWNFLLWGIYYAVLLFLEKLWLLDKLKKAPKPVSALYTLFFVALGWAIFSWQDIRDVSGFFASMAGFGGRGVVDSSAFYFIRSYVILLVTAAVGATTVPRRIWERITQNAALPTVVFEAAVCVLSAAYLVSDTYNPFLYFRF
ncbi:MAG: MBOAT family protein [Lachnospiraceae bacterium]|nr:MBOAT family protein [Lachnospiraceae bacterium]